MKSYSVLPEKANLTEIEHFISSILVFYNQLEGDWPAYVSVQLHEVQYPNGRWNRYYQRIRDGKRCPAAEFDQMVADGYLSEMPQTARLLGHLKPSTLAEAYADAA